MTQYWRGKKKKGKGGRKGQMPSKYEVKNLPNPLGSQVTPKPKVYHFTSSEVKALVVVAKDPRPAGVQRGSRGMILSTGGNEAEKVFTSCLGQQFFFFMCFNIVVLSLPVSEKKPRKLTSLVHNETNSFI